MVHFKLSCCPPTLLASSVGVKMRLAYGTGALLEHSPELFSLGCLCIIGYGRITSATTIRTTIEEMGRHQCHHKSRNKCH